MLGSRLANPELEMVDHRYAGLQRSGGVEEVEYKGKLRELSIIGIFAVSTAQEPSLHQVRVELSSLKSHKTKRHSLVGRIELDQTPDKLHKDLDLVEFAVAAIELDQDVTQSLER